MVEINPVHCRTTLARLDFESKLAHTAEYLSRVYKSNHGPVSTTNLFLEHHLWISVRTIN
jgi:hypothetical protein